MIFAHISDLRLYEALSPLFGEAVRSLASTDFSALEAGTYPLGDGGVYFMVQHPELKPAEDTLWECHDRYIDIQYAFTDGGETIGWSPRGDITDWARDPNGDISFSRRNGLGLPLRMSEGMLAVFFPQDAHRPGCGQPGAHGVKIVYKIPVGSLIGAE